MAGACDQSDENSQSTLQFIDYDDASICADESEVTSLNEECISSECAGGAYILVFLKCNELKQV